MSDDFPCDFRSEHAATVQKCQVCGPDKDRDIEVYQCHELDRPCSIHAHGLRQGNARTGPKLPVCIRCDLRTVDGVRVEPLTAVEIQQARRNEEQRNKNTPPCELQRTLAANVARLRQSAGLSLTATATTAQCNVHLIERIEQATHWPTPERLERLAAALGTTPAELLT